MEELKQTVVKEKVDALQAKLKASSDLQILIQFPLYTIFYKS